MCFTFFCKKVKVFSFIFNDCDLAYVIWGTTFMF